LLTKMVAGSSGLTRIWLIARPPNDVVAVGAYAGSIGPTRIGDVLALSMRYTAHAVEAVAGTVGLAGADVDLGVVRWRDSDCADG